MTNDAERVIDIVPVVWRYRLRRPTLPATLDEALATKVLDWKYMDNEPTYFAVPYERDDYEIEPLYTADIIEAQSKALAEARAIADRMREIIQDVWDKREGYTDRQAWSDLHGQAMQLLGWEVKSRALTPTPENPNG